MKPTDQLVEEHNAIKLVLRVLDKICIKLENNEIINPEVLDSIIDFIKIFADKCHHGKEEDLLFSAMEKSGIPRESGPIAVMLQEHKIGREYVGGLTKGVNKYKSASSASQKIIATQVIIKNARGYISLLSQHIEKEDNILYPMANKHISEEEQQILLKDFEIVERERIGPGKHEKYHALLKKLQEDFLS